MEPPPSEDPIPAKIVRLEETVINRIAAGEVVQRPSAAVKELIENCLDAGSTQVCITVKNGGLKLLQISDNGHGIRSNELDIVCERFTTSKLRSFEDLREIETFGFRGEALASITHVAHVTITSKTNDSVCAYRARYADGKLVSLPGSTDIQPKKCAGLNGTTIMVILIAVEDLFWNMPTRQKAFKSASEEYAKILDVVTRYSIHNGDNGVGFTCKRLGEASADLHTPSKDSGLIASTLGSIRIAFGASIARELLPFSCSAGGPAEEGSFSFSANGYISNANFNSKKPIFMLFINSRLVESVAIKRAVESVYKDHLPNHTYPFVYLSLTLPPRNVDVNVHPTKREVHFLHEDRLLNTMHSALSTCLQNANSSRTFFCQTLDLPERSSKTVSIAPVNLELESSSSEKLQLIDADNCDDESDKLSEGIAASTDIEVSIKRSVSLDLSAPQRKRTNRADNKLVRSDSRTQTLDVFLAPQLDSTVSSSSTSDETSTSSALDHSSSTITTDVFSMSALTNKRRLDECDRCPGDMAAVGAFASHSPTRKRLRPFVETGCTYESIRGLIAEIKSVTDTSLSALLKKHVFVGIVDHSLSLVQFDTKLLLVSHCMMARELFFQLAIRKFGCMGRCTLSSELLVVDSLVTALNLASSGWTVDDGPVVSIAKEAAKFLMAKAQMLEEYYNIQLVGEGPENFALVTVPVLLDGHLLEPSALPMMLLRLATEVDWDQEQSCFEGIALELAIAYAVLPEATSSLNSLNADEVDAPTEDLTRIATKTQDIVQHSWWPAFRHYLLPPPELSGEITQVACLEKLYKVFERC